MNIQTNAQAIEGTLHVPSDKSISHRTIMFGAISNGQTVVHDFLQAEDCLSTVSAFQQLGVPITLDPDGTVVIQGIGIDNFLKPNKPIDVGNSGTTVRLLSGILAGSQITATLTGDDSLRKRPMDRIITPLREMGATIGGQTEQGFLPLTITGSSQLKGINYTMPIASAQVKSALLFAGLAADGPTTIIEKERSRNHTEQMIHQFGGEIHVQGKAITLPGKQTLQGQELTVPGDISSAAFFIAATLLLPNSQLTLKNVGINPTRTGILDIIEAMGGKVKQTEIDTLNESADLTIQTSKLRSTTIEGQIIPRLIDELPILALLATQAIGKTIIRDAQELKVKETNRIDVVAEELNKLGANITPTEDGMIIDGPTPLHHGVVSSHGDHRIGMMLQIAALLVTDGPVELLQSEAIAISYPAFFTDLGRVVMKENE
ncbi:MAG: 3-phosphoshikimate 1-carboxyvinyltransferase [Enterococcus sp.]